MTQALGKFGVYGQPGTEELAVLALADEYRRELCALHQERHEALVDLRNRTFPSLLPALFEKERLYYQIAAIEREIKEYHSRIRDRDAVTEGQEVRLKAARQARQEAAAVAKHELAPWSALLKEFRQVYTAAADWKNVKSLDKRRAALARIKWPDHLRELADLWVSCDLRERELSRRYQEAGLHWTIRAEIVEASKPKIGKDGPGMRYQYGRRLEIKPWTKISLQFGDGGLPVSEALSGTDRQFSLTPVYVQRHVGRPSETVCRVRQKIGVGADVRWVEYTCKLHRELPPAAVIKRWSLVVEGSRRYAVPIVHGVDLTKPTGSGVLTYDLHWTTRQAGIEVASFLGDHVNERLVIPNWIVENRMALKDEQQRCDLLANKILTVRGATPQSGKKQGTDALEEWSRKHPDDLAASNHLDHMQERLQKALKISQTAARCIEDIYKVVASRVCRLHSQVIHDPLDLERIVKYDRRDLLRESLPQRTREIRHALAPGKLKSLLKGYGLMPCERSGDGKAPATTRVEETNIFTSFVDALGRKTGAKPQGPGNRSQCVSQSVLES